MAIRYLSREFLESIREHGLEPPIGSVAWDEKIEREVRIGFEVNDEQLAELEVIAKDLGLSRGDLFVAYAIEGKKYERRHRKEVVKSVLHNQTLELVKKYAYGELDVKSPGDYPRLISDKFKVLVVRYLKENGIVPVDGSVFSYVLNDRPVTLSHDQFVMFDLLVKVIRTVKPGFNYCWVKYERLKAKNGRRVKSIRELIQIGAQGVIGYRRVGLCLTPQMRTILKERVEAEGIRLSRGSSIDRLLSGYPLVQLTDSSFALVTRLALEKGIEVSKVLCRETMGEFEWTNSK